MTIEEILTQIMANIHARRGNLYETMVRKRRKDGTTAEYGPYTIWSRYENGRMRTSYVPRGEEDRYRQQIECGQRLTALTEELWKIAEASCAAEASPPKKKRRSVR